MAEFSPCMVGNPVFGSVAIYERPGVLQPPVDEGLLPRFIIQEAPFVQEALAHVGERVQSAMADDPAIAGATIFGSTVKGYVRQMRSDVDVNVFVNADTLGIPLRPHITEDDIDLPTWYPFDLANHHWPSVNVDYWRYIQGTLFPEKERAVLPVSPAVVPLSEDLLRLSAQREVELAEVDARYRALRQTTPPTWVDELADWAEVPTDWESLNAIHELVEAIVADKELSNTVDVMSVKSFLGYVALSENTELAWMRPTMIGSQRAGPAVPLRLFGLAITPGLEPFRKVFLDGLAKAAEPDIVWKFFCKRLAKFENSPKNPRDINLVSYPRTLAEAFDLYQ
jgi:hypothetical protein